MEVKCQNCSHTWDIEIHSRCYNCGNENYNTTGDIDTIKKLHTIRDIIIDDYNIFGYSYFPDVIKEYEGGVIWE